MKKILIVDDEPLIRRSLSRAFQSQGFVTLEAEDGLAGERQWREQKPDLVVLDVLMPGLTGPQLIEKMKATKGAKIVLISAFSGDYDVESVKKLGADLFISKPFQNIFDVVNQVKALLS